MNLRCMIGHQWERVSHGCATATTASLIGGTNDVDVFVVHEQCARCGKHRAYAEEATGRRHAISVAMMIEKEEEVRRTQ